MCCTCGRLLLANLRKGYMLRSLYLSLGGAATRHFWTRSAKFVQKVIRSIAALEQFKLVTPFSSGLSDCSRNVWAEHEAGIALLKDFR